MSIRGFAVMKILELRFKNINSLYGEWVIDFTDPEYAGTELNAKQKDRETRHGLIGSADGKKYRNFAQGRTFELMVSHANRQLEKMTDRYLLIRDEQQQPELNVVDNYQAGEIRSTKNLSGGESFIVSLALGLSKMGRKAND